MAMSTDPKVCLPEFQSPSLSQANNFGELFFYLCLLMSNMSINWGRVYRALWPVSDVVSLSQVFVTI